MARDPLTVLAEIMSAHSALSVLRMRTEAAQRNEEDAVCRLCNLQEEWRLLAYPDPKGAPRGPEGAGAA
jgi:hypothetical protein